MPIRTFKQLIYEATWLGPKKVAIAYAADASVLHAAHEAQQLGMADCLLVDDAASLQRVATDEGIEITGMTIIDIADEVKAAAKVMQLARDGEADVVMKGALSTILFMKAVLDRESGIRVGKQLSHVAAFEIPELQRLLLISDGGVNIAPDIYEKVGIVQNAIDVAHKLGIDTPRVAVLAASEFVNPKIPTTLDAALIAKMSDRGQIRGGVVDGPLALDNAISQASAHAKGIASPVAGAADVLIVPDIDAGNLLAKAITYFAHGEMAGVVVGAKVPIVVASRADSHVTKLVSIALSVALTSDIPRAPAAETQ